MFPKRLRTNGQWYTAGSSKLFTRWCPIFGPILITVSRCEYQNELEIPIVHLTPGLFSCGPRLAVPLEWADDVLGALQCTISEPLVYSRHYIYIYIYAYLYRYLYMLYFNDNIATYLKLYFQSRQNTEVF